MSATLPVSVDTLCRALPLSRPGSAEDMAGAALYLSSRAAAWVTGIVLPVEGGQLSIARL